MSYYVNPHGHQCPWYPYSELLGYPSANWCEEVSCYWISEPISTYSSLIFIIMASILFGSLRKKSHPDLKLYLNLLLLIGVGNALYHVSLNYGAQLLSHGLTYTFFGAFILKNLIRKAKLGYSQRNKYLALYTLGMLFLEHILYMNFLTTQILIPLNFVLVLFTEFGCKKYESQKIHYHYLVFGFILLVFAEISSMADLFKIYCNPKSLFFHGRALWHFLAAFSFSLLYLHQLQLYPDKEVFEDELDLEADQPVIETNEIAEDFDEEHTEQEEQKEANTPQFDSVLDLSEEPEIDEDEDQSDENEEDGAQLSFGDFETIDDSSSDQDEIEEEKPSGVYTSDELPNPNQFSSLEDDDEDSEKD